MNSMLFHRIIFINGLILISIIIWIHYKDRIPFWNSPFNLWEHGAQLKAIVDTNRSCPKPSSNSSSTLDEDQSCLGRINFGIRLIKLLWHEYIALGPFCTLFFWLIEPLLRYPDLVETTLFHGVLYILLSKVTKLIILNLMLIEIKWLIDIISCPYNAIL